MQKRKLEVGEIVQVDPNCDIARRPDKWWFGACLLVVTEPTEWGGTGYVQNAGEDGQAYIRFTFDQVEPTGGRAVWRPVEA